MEAISLLNCPVLSAEQIKVLVENRIKTIMDFLKAPADVVCSSLNLTDSDYSTIRMAVLKSVQPEPLSLLEVASTNKIIPRSTGIKGFDKMLGGGLFPGDIIELYGKTGSGKTQLCLYLTSQLCHFSDDDSCVMYFDMKNDFNVMRLYKFCNETEESLKRVEVFKLPNLEGLLSQLDEVKNRFIGGIKGSYSKTRLLVVDSVPMIIYPAVDEEPYSWRFHLEKFVEKIGWLADHLNLTVILVNHAVTTRPGNSSSASSTSSAATVKAAMGKYWFHKINIRIHLQCNIHSNRFVAELEKCGRSSEGQKFQFILNDEKLLEVV